VRQIRRVEVQAPAIGERAAPVEETGATLLGAEVAASRTGDKVDAYPGDIEGEGDPIQGKAAPFHWGGEKLANGRHCLCGAEHAWARGRRRHQALGRLVWPRHGQQQRAQHPC
jgi:hypothetical protein